MMADTESDTNSGVNSLRASDGNTVSTTTGRTLKKTIKGLCESVTGFHKDVKAYAFSRRSVLCLPCGFCIWMIYRLILFLFCVVVFIFWHCVPHTLHPSVYLTTWTYCTLCVYLLMAIVVDCLHLIRWKTRCRCLFAKSILLIWWMFANISFTFSIAVTLIAYFTNVDGEDKGKFLNISVHGINSVIIILDIILCQRPVRIEAVVWPVLYGLIYVTFSRIYFVQTNIAIYAFLDRNEPWIIPIVLVCVIAMQVFMFFVPKIHAWLVESVSRSRPSLATFLSCCSSSSTEDDETRGILEHDTSV